MQGTRSEPTASNQDSDISLRIEITSDPENFEQETGDQGKEKDCSHEDRSSIAEKALLKEQQEVVDGFLPEAQTCFFSLSLPNYSTAEVLKEKLLQAITTCKAIDTDFIVRDTATTPSPLASTTTTTTYTPRDTTERRRRRLLRSRTHNSSDHSQPEAAVALSEEGHSQTDSATGMTRSDSNNLLLQLEKSYESFSQSWM